MSKGFMKNAGVIRVSAAIFQSVMRHSGRVGLVYGLLVVRNDGAKGCE